MVTEHHWIEQFLPWLITYCLHHVAAIVLKIVRAGQPNHSAGAQCFGTESFMVMRYTVDGTEQQPNLMEGDAAVAVNLVGGGGGGGIRVHDSLMWSPVQNRGRHWERLVVEHSFDLLKQENWQ